MWRKVAEYSLNHGALYSVQKSPLSTLSIMEYQCRISRRNGSGPHRKERISPLVEQTPPSILHNMGWNRSTHSSQPTIMKIPLLIYKWTSVLNGLLRFIAYCFIAWSSQCKWYKSRAPNHCVNVTTRLRLTDTAWHLLEGILVWACTIHPIAS